MDPSGSSDGHRAIYKCHPRVFLFQPNYVLANPSSAEDAGHVTRDAADLLVTLLLQIDSLSTILGVGQGNGRSRQSIKR